MQPSFGEQLGMGHQNSSDPDWVHELQNWMTDYSWTETTGFNEPDIDWFLNNQCSSSADLCTYACTEGDYETAKTLVQIVDHSNRFEHMPPMLLQETPTKLFVAKTGEFSAPNCGFRTCSALSEDLRTTLLVDLQKMIDIDVRDRLFSLNSLKQGIHLYFRHINIEHNFLHHEFFIPSSEETRRARLEVCGLDSEPGAVLYWAIISIGWTLMRSEGGHEHRMAVQIQRALRKTVINVCFQPPIPPSTLTTILATKHPGLTGSPPLWLVQALFIVLMFARYQGDREEYGFASMFHGVLLEVCICLLHPLNYFLVIPLSGYQTIRLQVISFYRCQSSIRH